MFPYWVLFSIFAAGSLEATRRRSLMAGTTPLLALAGISTVLMIGLRYEVGGDWYTYEDTFRTISYVDDVAAVLAFSDPAYAALNWIGARLGLGIWFVNLICAAIFMWGLLRFSRRQPNPWLAMAIAVPYLVIVVAMGYSRQGVAIGIVLGMLAVFERTTPLRMVFYIIAAAAFHKSALVVLPVVALSVARRSPLAAGVLGFAAVALYYLFVDAFADTLIANYVTAEYSSEGAWVRVGMNVVPAAIFLAFQKRFTVTDRERPLWLLMSFAAILCAVLLLITPSSTAIDRTALYLIPLQIFVLSRIPQTFAARGRANPYVLLVIAYSALIQFVWLNFAVHAASWVPYRASLPV